MRYLSGKDLTGLVPPVALVEAIEEALRDFAAHKVRVPVRQHLDFGENTLLTMPAVGGSAFGVKIVSVVPSNAARGLPVIRGLMALNDGTDGAPLAIMDAATLTAQRTGAVGAVGVKYTTPADVDSVGIIGVGAQGISQAIFACAVRPIRTVYFVARSAEKARTFVEAVLTQVPSVQVVPCQDARELLTRAAVVITATTSSTPVLPDEPEQLVNKHFVSVGSFKPSMQELPFSVYEIAGEVAIDSDAAKHEVGDLVNPLSRGVLREENVFHLADLVTGKRTVDRARTTVFKSVGQALYDLYCAQAFYSEAQRTGRGAQLDVN